MSILNSFSLEGKVALVTGGAYGIGFAIAEAYAKAGAKIAFNCRGQEHLDKALEDYAAKGIEAKGYICDVTNEEQVKEMVASIEKDLGVIDILVNNAGIIKRIPMTEEWKYICILKCRKMLLLCITWENQQKQDISLYVMSRLLFHPAGPFIQEAAVSLQEKQ